MVDNAPRLGPGSKGQKAALSFLWILIFDSGRMAPSGPTHLRASAELKMPAFYQVHKDPAWWAVLSSRYQGAGSGAGKMEALELKQQVCGPALIAGNPFWQSPYSPHPHRLESTPIPRSSSTHARRCRPRGLSLGWGLPQRWEMLGSILACAHTTLVVITGNTPDTARHPGWHNHSWSEHSVTTLGYHCCEFFTPHPQSRKTKSSSSNTEHNSPSTWGVGNEGPTG